MWHRPILIISVSFFENKLDVDIIEAKVWMVSFVPINTRYQLHVLFLFTLTLTHDLNLWHVTSTCTYDFCQNLSEWARRRRHRDGGLWSRPNKYSISILSILSIVTLTLTHDPDLLHVTLTFDQTFTYDFCQLLLVLARCRRRRGGVRLFCPNIQTSLSSIFNTDLDKWPWP
jgi:hypothetical protein